MVSTLKLNYIFSLPLDLNSQRIILHMKIFFLVIFFSILVLFYLLGPPPRKKKRKKKNQCIIIDSHNRKFVYISQVEPP